jgi:hypothetical protein
MFVMRGLAALAAVALIAAVAAPGCSDGLSQSDAELRCTQEQTSKEFCFDSNGNTFNMCMSCFESCGNDCMPQGDCPEQYLCPGQSPLDAGSDAL